MKNIIIILIMSFNVTFANINFTKNEIEFINNSKISCVSTNSWAPFNMQGANNNLDGLALDYLNLIIKKSNLNINCEVLNNWTEVINEVKTKKSDFTLATSISKKKQKYANFSKPYLTYPIAIATTLDKVFISNEEYLSNKTIAVGEGYSAYYILKEKYKNIKFIIVKNTDEALKLLSQNKVDAVVDILPVLSYNITKLGLANIKIAGITKYNFEVRFMFSNDEKFLPLISILNKSINNITIEEKRIISDKWINVKFKYKFDYSLFYKIILPLFLLLLYFLYSNKKLQKEVKLKKIAQKKLENKVNTDNLTGVYNRHYLNQISDELISNTTRYKENLTFIMLDIDDFKNINDTYGHIVGDDVIREISYKLKHLTRPSDIIIRYGGEEFLIILQKSSLEDSYIVAQKLRLGIEKLNISSSTINNSFKVTISLGLASFDYKKHILIDNAINNADKALYEAKHEGKNKIVVFKED